MGDHFSSRPDHELSNLPPEAWDNTFDADGPFEASNFWLERASRDDQAVALRGWFLVRYCDPIAAGTPWDKERGCYVFLRGGPVYPEDVLRERFEGLVDERIIRSVVHGLVEESGQDWVPLPHVQFEPDGYDERFNIYLTEQNEPRRQLLERLSDARRLLQMEGPDILQITLHRLVYASGISTLEAFLYETASYWVDTDEEVIVGLITGLPAFSNEQIKLSDIYQHHSKLKERVKAHFQGMVWHQWKHVAPIFEKGLGIKLPSLRQFDTAVLKRHDIVHRSGRNKDGEVTLVALEEISALFDLIESFAKATETSIALRAFKRDSPDEDRPEKSR